MDHYIIIKRDYKDNYCKVTIPFGEYTKEYPNDEKTSIKDFELVLIKWALEEYRKRGEYGKWYLAVDKPDFQRYEMVNDIEVVFEVSKSYITKRGNII